MGAQIAKLQEQLADARRLAAAAPGPDVSSYRQQMQVQGPGAMTATPTRSGPHGGGQQQLHALAADNAALHR